MRTFPICLFVCLALLLAAPAAAKDDDYPKLAPFTATRFEGEQVHIEVQGTWYRLKAIDKARAADLVAFAKKAFEEKWQERITEDLVEVLAKMGHKPGATVALTLVAEDGKVISLPRVAMTRANRQRARRAFEDRDRPRRPRPRGRRDDHTPKLAPFTAARIRGDTVLIEVDSTWYQLLSIDGIAATDMLAFSKKTYGGSAEKRIVEDLVEVMTRMGKKPGATVALDLERQDNRKRVLMPAVPMTEDNRKRAWRARGMATRGALRVERVHREHAGAAAPAFGHLTKLVEGARGRTSLSRAKALQDLDQLEWFIQNVHSYATLRGIDIEAALDAARLGIPERISRNTFAIQVMKVLALLGDGHARVAENPARVLAHGFLPFLLGDVGVGRPPVALYASREALLDDGHPYVSKLDGVEWQKWAAAASRIVAHGSPQLVHRRSLGIMRHVQHVRRELGLPETKTIEVELASEDGKRSKTLVLPYSDDKPLYGTWPRTNSRRLKGDIGYLRIDRMDGDRGYLDTRVGELADFRDTKGLIIDVRGNGGGTRHALKTLLQYFLEPGHAVVANIACYRIPPRTPPNDEGFLQDRFLFPRSSRVWSADDRLLIDAAAKGFKPGWQVPSAGFSPWHYFIISNQGEARYPKPTVVLTDSGCFSATDIFVGAMAGSPQVTLMGTATSGGSGRSRSYTLANSRLRLRLSSMASFRHDGQPYDTKGIAPDIEVPVKPTDLLGQTDSALEAALERLKK